MITQGDCIAVMDGMERETVSAIVTDPPYGIGFMGHEWDQIGPYGATRSDGKDASRARGHRNLDGTPVRGAAMAAGLYDLSPSANRRYQSWCEEWGTAALRLAKPGAHLLSFGSTRTVHRLAAGLEDAGWEIRDTLVWAYASGFPKSLNVERAIAVNTCPEPGRHFARLLPPKESWQAGDHVCDPTLESQPWEGWGTALKPSWEPIVLARKPFSGPVGAQVTRYGTGALNIDATRTELSEADRAAWEAAGGYFTPGTPIGHSEHTDFRQGSAVNLGVDPGKGRWPANVILGDPIFDGGIDGVEGGGESETHSAVLRRAGMGFKGDGAGTGPHGGYLDEGTYSRFFLIPKASRGDREPILGGLEPRELITHGARAQGPLPQQTPQGPIRRANHHPTVKPLELMKRLVRLVTPPGGLVLDPFLGSGTTALAAEQEGFPWVGIERDSDYVAIAEARLNGTQKGLGLG